MSPENSKNIGLTESESFRAMENLQEIQRLPSINPINLNYFGAEQCEKGYVFGSFVRTSYVIHIIRKGKGKLRKISIHRLCFPFSLVLQRKAAAGLLSPRKS